MALLQIIPEIFYDDINTGLRFFVDGLGFNLVYNDDILYLVKRDELTIMLSVNTEFAKSDRPQIRIKTDRIEEIYDEINLKDASLLHPNLNYIKNQPWGLREFAVLDPTTVCIVFQQDQS
ncbi:hypothetical protein [Pedobacter antarcticus]|uniref:hypothetical protein n=1 Tax=Pedobacter antarcticus TaxID=34086 RepID=UPI001C55E975|nr:hypothetical protein [Pedobacter antarcticus]